MPATDRDLLLDQQAARGASSISEDASQVISVIEEELSVGKREVITGRVRLEKHVDTEEITFDLERVDRSFSVERRPVGQVYDTPPEAVRQEGDATVYAVIREVPVVVTRYELVEEIVVSARREVTSEAQTVQRRVERVDIERSPGDEH